MTADTISARADRAGSGSTRSFELLAGTRFRPEPIRWLWPQWLALGKLQLLAGSAGTRKTKIAGGVGAAGPTGGGGPGGGPAREGGGLVWRGGGGHARPPGPARPARGGEPRALPSP